jgi:hypothetical protein
MMIWPYWFHFWLELAMVQVRAAAILIATDTVPPAQFSNSHGAQLPKDTQFQTQTAPITAIFLPDRAYNRVSLHELSTLAPIQSLNSDSMAIWYILCLWRLQCSFIDSSSIWDPINTLLSRCANTLHDRSYLLLFSEYWSHGILENGRWKIIQHCIIYICIILWYDQNSNT